MAGHLPKAEAAPACAGPPPVILSFILCIFPLLQRLLDQAEDESLLCQLLAGLLPLGGQIALDSMKQSSGIWNASVLVLSFILFPPLL